MTSARQPIVVAPHLVRASALGEASPGAHPASRPDSVQVRVAALALSGVTAREGARLSTAFEGELRRLLVGQQLPQQSADTERILVARFVMPAGEPIERTGRRLARIVAEKVSA